MTKKIKIIVAGIGGVGGYFGGLLAKKYRNSKEVEIDFVAQSDGFNGCVYIIARLNKAGEVERTGNIHKLCFGIENATNEELVALEKILREAGIETKLSEDISSITWEKFI